MDIILLIAGFIFLILGIIGAFLPVLPGPLISWLSLLAIHLTKTVETNWTFLLITLAIAVFVFVIDNFIPAMGTKKFGGTRLGVIGTMVGLVVGLLFFGPFGIIVGPFAGAFIGEMIADRKDSKKALKSAVGSFLGFLTSTLLKFIMSVVFAGFYFSIFWEHKGAFFSF